MEFIPLDICGMNENKGTLYLVATPIGNLDDITLRALKTLEEADIIYCEDTRQTIKLLNHFDIKNQLAAYHKFNEKKETDKIINELKDGKNIALVSDAGLPLISDPGSILVEECKLNDIPVTVVPGANAALSALMLSGMDTRRFTFFGFPEKNKKKNKEFIADLGACKNTAIVYESPHHLLKLLKELEEIDPDRKMSISREITKRYEQTVNGTVKELKDYFTENEPKGEFVLVLEPSEKEAVPETFELSIEEQFENYLSQGMSEKEAMKKIASERGLKRRDIYNQLKVKK